MKFNDFVDGVKWHMSNNIPLHESVYRFGSDKYFETFAEARKLYNEGKLQNLHEWDEELLRDTDLGKFVNVKGVGRVPLDMPISEEEHLRFEAENDDQLKGFDPRTAYAIKRLHAKYPHAQDLLSALLGDVEKNELDSDKADISHDNKLIDLSDRLDDIEKKLKKIIKSNSLKEAELTEISRRDFLVKSGILGTAAATGGSIGTMNAAGLKAAFGPTNSAEKWDGKVDPEMVDLMVKYVQRNPNDYDGLFASIRRAENSAWKDPKKLQAYKAAVSKELGLKEMSFTESDNELEYNGKLHKSVDYTVEHDDPSFCYDCKLVSTTHGEIDTEYDEADVVCPRCGSQAYVEASPEEMDKYSSPEAWMNEAEYQGKNVELSKPKRGGSKKFYVYVMNPKTKKVKKVSFGAAGGGGNLAVKLKDPKARKAFADRHNCDQKNDKTKPGYWACRLPRYAKSLGLSGGGTWW